MNNSRRVTHTIIVGPTMAPCPPRPELPRRRLPITPSTESACPSSRRMTQWVLKYTKAIPAQSPRSATFIRPCRRRSGVSATITGHSRSPSTTSMATRNPARGSGTDGAVTGLAGTARIGSGAPANQPGQRAGEYERDGDEPAPNRHALTPAAASGLGLFCRAGRRRGRNQVVAEDRAGVRCGRYEGARIDADMSSLHHLAPR